MKKYSELYLEKVSLGFNSRHYTFSEDTLKRYGTYCELEEGLRILGICMKHDSSDYDIKKQHLRTIAKEDGILYL